MTTYEEDVCSTCDGAGGYPPLGCPDCGMVDPDLKEHNPT